MDGVEILTSGFGPRGPLGPSGPSGPIGPRGIFGGNGFAFTFSTDITDTDPGPGVVKFNSATYGDVSEIFIDLEDSEGTDITSWVNSLADANNIPAAVIKIFSQVEPTRWATFTLISVTSAVGYRKLAVEPVASSSAFTAVVGDTNLVFAPAGNQGVIGAPCGPTWTLATVTATGPGDAVVGTFALLADQASIASGMFLNRTDASGASLGVFLDAIAVGDSVYISTVDGTTFPELIGTISSKSFSGTVYAIGWGPTFSGGGTFAVGTKYGIYFSKRGPTGPTGPAGGPAGAANDIVFLSASGVSTVDTGNFVWNPSDKGLDIRHPTQRSVGNNKGRISFWNLNGSGAPVEYGRIQSFCYGDTTSSLVLSATGTGGAVHEGLQLYASSGFPNSACYVSVGGGIPGAQLQVTAAAASTIGQIIKLAATPSAHALDINSSAGSGGDLAYISQAGAAYFKAATTTLDLQTATYALTLDADSPAPRYDLYGAYTLMRFNSWGGSYGVIGLYGNYDGLVAASDIIFATSSDRTRFTGTLNYHLDVNLRIAGNTGFVGIGDFSTLNPTAQLHIRGQAVNTYYNSTSLLLVGGAHTNLAASTEAIDVNFNLARTVQFAAGALATQRAFVVQSPTYSFVAASTITTAATLAITGAPVAGANATITNPLAFWVQAGAARFDGQLNVNVPTAGTIGQIIKLAATPSAHALDINSSSGSGGDLAYISQTGGACFAGSVLTGGYFAASGSTNLLIYTNINLTAATFTSLEYYNQTTFHSAVKITNVASGFGNLELMSTGGTVIIGGFSGSINVVIGSAAIATNATDGFLYIPSCAGTPTGTPTAFTGRVPLVYDDTNHILYIYEGAAWKKATASLITGAITWV